MKRISARLFCSAAAAVLSVAPAWAGSHGNRLQDPFAVPNTRKVVVPKPVEKIVPPPPLDERRSTCKTSADAGKQIDSLPCMYLVHEVSLTGVFRSDAQPEAFLFAKPTRQTIVVHEGDKLFDGRVVSIREAAGSAGPQIVLERTVQHTKGKTVTTTQELVTLKLGNGSDL